jgi:hypothetical protein
VKCGAGKQKLRAKQCRQLGECCILLFFCPQNAAILTTNTRDLSPLAEAFGKKTQAPDAAG